VIVQVTDIKTKIQKEKKAKHPSGFSSKLRFNINIHRIITFLLLVEEDTATISSSIIQISQKILVIIAKLHPHS
jgi:hypothetical protein